MIVSGFGSSMNMLFIILIVSGVLLLLLLLFYYISLAVDSWDVKNNNDGIEEKKKDFLDVVKEVKSAEEIGGSEKTIKSQIK